MPLKDFQIFKRSGMTMQPFGARVTALQARMAVRYDQEHLADGVATRYEIVQISKNRTIDIVESRNRKPCNVRPISALARAKMHQVRPPIDNVIEMPLAA